jgi:hypothetical protein
MIAHIGALPVEEVLPVLAGAGGGLLAVRTCVMSRLRRRRGPGGEPLHVRARMGRGL